MVQTTTLTETLSAAWSGIGAAASGAKDTINGMVDSINMASVAIGAVIGLGANRVFQDARLEDAIDEQFRGAQNLEVRKFVDDNSVLMVGDEIKRVLVNNNKLQIDLKESMSLINVLSQAQFSNAGLWGTDNKSVEGVMSMINSMSTRSRESVKKGKDLNSLQLRMLKGLGVGEVKGKDFKAAEKELRQEGVKIDKSKGEDLDKIFRRAMETAFKKSIKVVDWSNLTDSQRLLLFQNNLEKLRDSIEDNIIPVLVRLVSWITWLIETIGKIPGAAPLMAYATVFATVGVVVSRLAGTFGVLTKGIGAATTALKLYQTAALSSNMTKVMQAQGIFGPVQQLTGPKAALNAPLQRLGGFAGSIGLATSVKDGKVTEGLFTSMKTASIAAGSGIRGAFAAAGKGVVGAFGVMRAAAAQFFKFLLSNPLVAVGALIAAIVLLAYKFGYLHRAWKAFASSEFGKDILAFFNILEFKIKVVWAGIKGLFSILMGGIGSKLSSGIVAAFEAISKIIGNVWNKFNAFYSALKGGDISLVLGAAGGLFESLGFLGPMFWLLSFTFKILKTIYDFLKDPVTKIKEFLGFIWNVLTGLWKWLMKAIPGAEKASMKSKMEKEAEKEGKKYGEKWGVSASGEYITLDENGKPTGNKVMASKITPKMKELQGKYETLPGFAEGIADAVKQGISGFAKTIAEEIGTRLEAAFDAIFGEGTFEATMKSLSETLDALQDWLEDNGIMDKKGTPEQQAAAHKLMEEKGGIFNEDTGKWKFGDLPEGQLPEDLKTTDWAAKALGWFPGIGPGILSKYFNDSIETPEDLEKAFLKALIEGALPQAASGAGILESGPLFGHANESIVPAKLATSSTLIDTLTKIADSKKSGSVSGDSVTIHNTFNFHSHGSAGFDAKTRSELTTFIDNYMARALRHRQAH